MFILLLYIFFKVQQRNDGEEESVEDLRKGENIYMLFVKESEDSFKNHFQKIVPGNALTSYQTLNEARCCLSTMNMLLG